jgi:hypothetical protein
MSRFIVKNNVQSGREILGWEGALADAKRNLEKAERDALEWKAAVRVCRKKVADSAPWPGGEAVGKAVSHV